MVGSRLSANLPPDALDHILVFGKSIPDVGFALRGGQMFQCQRVVACSVCVQCLLIGPEIGPRERHPQRHFSTPSEQLCERFAGMMADCGSGV